MSARKVLVWTVFAGLFAGIIMLYGQGEGVAESEYEYEESEPVIGVPSLSSKGGSPQYTGSQRLPIPGARVASLSRADIESTFLRLKQLSRCMDDEDCDFPKIDPRSYSIAVGEAIARELLRISGSQEEGVGEIARQYMNFRDDQVKVAALEVLASMSPNPANIDAVITGISDSQDGILYRQAIYELKRYDGSEDREKVRLFLSKTLTRGSPYAAQVVAEEMLGFLNPSNVGRYQRVLRELPQNSKRYSYLRSSLEEFRRLQAGG